MKDWVIVSGGSGSIGRGLVQHFLRQGRPVLSLDRAEGAASGTSDADLVSRTVNLTAAADVSAVLGEAIPRSDRIGLLVNAVGLIWNEPLVSLRGASFRPHRPETWRDVLEANLTAPFIVASEVAARMARTGGGAIVNFSSICGRGHAGQVAYSAAKAGVEGLTRAMAAELGPIGIRVNAVAPGFFDVPSTHAALTDEQVSALEGRTPFRRLGQLDELLQAVEFLSQNSFVTGIVLDINGGLRI